MLRLECSYFLVLLPVPTQLPRAIPRAMFQHILHVWVYSQWSYSAHIIKLLQGVQLYCPRTSAKSCQNYKGQTEHIPFSLFLHMLFLLLGVSLYPSPFSAWLTTNSFSETQLRCPLLCEALPNSSHNTSFSFMALNLQNAPLWVMVATVYLFWLADHLFYLKTATYRMI